MTNKELQDYIELTYANTAKQILCGEGSRAYLQGIQRAMSFMYELVKTDNIPLTDFINVITAARNYIKRYNDRAYTKGMYEGYKDVLDFIESASSVPQPKGNVLVNPYADDHLALKLKSIDEGD